MCLKGLIAAAFESSEPLHFLRLNGVSAPSLHRVYQLSNIHLLSVLSIKTMLLHFSNGI